MEPLIPQNDPLLAKSQHNPPNPNPTAASVADTQAEDEDDDEEEYEPTGSERKSSNKASQRRSTPASADSHSAVARTPAAPKVSPSAGKVGKRAPGSKEGTAAATVNDSNGHSQSHSNSHSHSNSSVVGGQVDSNSVEGDHGPDAANASSASAAVSNATPLPPVLLRAEAPDAASSKVSRRNNFSITPARDSEDLVFRVPCQLPPKVDGEAHKAMRLVQERPSTNEIVQVLHTFDSGTSQICLGEPGEGRGLDC